MSDPIEKHNSDSLVSRRYLVTGKVQGVWFRRFTQEQAALCEVKGYAKNLQNGQVEVFLQGTLNAIQIVSEQLKKGPRLATVESVIEVDASDSPIVTGFKVL